MENRFGIKDFFLFLLLIALIVFVLLAMVQYDRQWEVMQQINRQLTEQTTDLSRIHRLLDQGASTTRVASSDASANDLAAAFPRVLKSEASADFAQGGTLNLMSQATPAKLSPMIATDQFAFDIWGYVMDTLITRDPDTLAWLPSLATAWKISDDSLTIDFTLRRGVTFSDGSPLSADDVVFTFNFINDPRIEDPIMKVGCDRIDDVEKIDDDHVRFVFKEPYYKSLEVSGGTPIMSKAFYSKYSPTDYNRSTGLLIGSGPYRMPDPTSWKPTPGEPIVLVRNERYWGPTPSFDKLVWKVIEQPAARVTSFRNGEIDFLGGSDGPPTPEQYKQLIADPQILKQTNHWELTNPTEGWYYLGWNEKHGRDGPPTPFADVRVRQAMTMLTDRQTMLKTIMNGYADLITSCFAPNTSQCDPSIQPWPYDVDGAVKLLAEAGFHREGDRMMGPDGKPFSFQLMYNTNSEPRRRIASFLRDAYAKVGIEVNVKNEEFSVFQQRMDDRNYEVAIGAWGGSLESDPYEELHSSQIAKTGEDFIQYSNPMMDALIEQARSTVDDAKRQVLWHRLHQLIHQEQPYTYLFIYRELDIANNRIHGMTPTKILGISPFNEWYLPKELQTAQ
jgi:peptide/nickel transport system substrate-binding protein